MSIDRREFFRFSAGSVLASAAISPLGSNTIGRTRYRAIAFDAFTVFDPRPAGALAESLFPGRGAELFLAWRTRQFEYQWLRASAGQYVEFIRVTEDSLVFAAKQLRLELTPDRRSQLLQAYTRLDAWPDVAPALHVLRAANVRLALLSNATEAMLRSGIERAGLYGMFEHVLSTDDIRTYKPDRRAYQLGVDALGLRREEIVFAAFAGWDVAGAKWFGYPTVWINRLGAEVEELGVLPNAAGRDIGVVTEFVGARG